MRSIKIRSKLDTFPVNLGQTCLNLSGICAPAVSSLCPNPCASDHCVFAKLLRWRLAARLRKPSQRRSRRLCTSATARLAQLCAGRRRARSPAGRRPQRHALAAPPSAPREVRAARSGLMFHSHAFLALGHMSQMCPNPSDRGALSSVNLTKSVRNLGAV